MTGPPAPLPRVRASWRRSEQYGVPPDEVLPLYTDALDTGSLLHECATSVLTGLQSTIAGEPVSLMVADRDGVVLTRLCSDQAMRRSLDRVHLAPGFSYAERQVGTNGLGLSLADRAPSLVRAADHYCTELRGYTCAAVPVLDLVSGDLVGTINLTTWSDSSSELLLALAQAAAGATSGLMLQRATGRPLPVLPRGEVFRVIGPAARAEADPCVSAGWRSARHALTGADRAGRMTAVVGEPGVGKATLAARVRRDSAARPRILRARTPGDDGVAAWLDLWTPELHGADVCVVVSGTERLPDWAAERLAGTLAAAHRPAGSGQPVILTAPEFGAIPAALGALVDAVVEVPPLRRRPDDVLPLAQAIAHTRRHRDVAFTARAEHALRSYAWPGNVAHLQRIVREAVGRADVVDVHHLDPEVLDGSSRALSRLERLERDEIVRCLTEPGTTMARVAGELGIGRATLYRKIAQYGIAVPGRAAGPR